MPEMKKARNQKPRTEVVEGLIQLDEDKMEREEIAEKSVTEFWVVGIEYVDSAIYNNSMRSDDCEGTVDCFAVGFLINQTEKSYILAQEWQPEWKTYKRVLAIPRCAVKNLYKFDCLRH